MFPITCTKINTKQKQKQKGDKTKEGEKEGKTITNIGKRVGCVSLPHYSGPSICSLVFHVHRKCVAPILRAIYIYQMTLPHTSVPLVFLYRIKGTLPPYDTSAPSTAELSLCHCKEVISSHLPFRFPINQTVLKKKKNISFSGIIKQCTPILIKLSFKTK